MTKYRAEDYIGKTFNRLTILEAAGVRRYHPIVLAQCSCGTVKHIELCAILTEHTKSCGCYNQELRRERGKVSNLKHGYFGKPEYKSWSHILSMVGVGLKFVIDGELLLRIF